jgi:hypothetical protein
MTEDLVIPLTQVFFQYFYGDSAEKLSDQLRKLGPQQQSQPGMINLRALEQEVLVPMVAVLAGLTRHIPGMNFNPPRLEAVWNSYQELIRDVLAGPQGEKYSKFKLTSKRGKKKAAAALMEDGVIPLPLTEIISIVYGEEG